ncbi:hypothetical protein [Pseudomonas fluorescens]|uniref:Uncharacterized protein n=1 Tax=Pseudomonas fluorescens TaxID=294 RepID=A0A0F4TR48_PSEFL|nr:hypothetical protein [Pseudomonas fluorescens]KJZ46534.1 hypothetical protein VC34_07425 [Pseudomonas fluorescens]
MKKAFYVANDTALNKAPNGQVSAKIEGKSDFEGSATLFSTNKIDVFLQSRQNISEKRWNLIDCRFAADITNGQHDYVEGGKIYSLHYTEVEVLPDYMKFTPYSAVHGSGHLDLNFNLNEGTFEASFSLTVQNNPTDSLLKSSGNFKDISGLEYVK